MHFPTQVGTEELWVRLGVPLMGALWCSVSSGGPVKETSDYLFSDLECVFKYLETSTLTLTFFFFLKLH